MILAVLLMFSLIGTPVSSPDVIVPEPTWATTVGSNAYARPLMQGDLIFIAFSDGTVRAFNANNGSVAWQTVLDEYPASQIALHEGLLFLPGDRGTLFVVAADDGELQDALSLSADPLTEPLIVGDALVIADTLGVVTILDLDTFDVRSQLLIDRNSGDGVILDDMAVFVSAGGLVTAIDVQTESIRWQSVIFGAGTAIGALDNGDVIVANNEAGLSRLSGANGDVVWQEVHGGGTVVEAEQSAHGLVVVTDEGQVRNIDVETGAVLWATATPNPVMLAPGYCEDQCIAADNSGALYAINAEDGSWHAIAVASSSVVGSFDVIDGLLIGVTSEGDVVVWQLSGG